MIETLEDRLLLSVATEDCGCGGDAQRSEAVLSAAALSAAPAAAASRVAVADMSVNAASPDSDDTDPAAWQIWTGVDANFLTARINEGYRIGDIEVDATNPLRFTAALIHNSGSHAKAWWWYYNTDVATISGLLTQNNARLVDIESYVDGGQQKYAAVMISNTGADQARWWWYVNANSATVEALRTQNNARLTDIDRHNHGNADAFDVIMVDNTGPGGRAWWYYYNATPDQISGLISTNNARLVDIEPVDPGHFDVIMERSGISAWWWYYGLTAQDALDTALQNGARVFDIEQYGTLFGTRYAVLMVNNSNEVTTRVGEILRASNATADTGLYLKQVGGPVLAGLRQDDRFEPASMIKALLNLTAMRAVQGGQANLNDPLFMYFNPAAPYHDFNDPGNPDECPDSYNQTASNRALMMMQEVLERMMERSDNRATRTIDQRFGRPLINATADIAGMTNTDFASTLGCGMPGNYLTLVDTGKMYEGVLNNTLLNAANANTYFRMMTDDNDADRELVPFGEGVFGPFQTVVRQEAAALLGKPETDPQVQLLANRFIQAMTGAWKGGGYTLGAFPNWREVRTAGGYVGLPFWGDSGINNVNYVYGIFIDNATVPQSNPDPGRAKINQAWNDSQGELLREEIRKALATWRPTVQQVYVANTGWTAAFKNYLGARNLGDATYGYQIPAGANQLDVLPWAINQVSVKFNQSMSVQQADLAIRGVNTANYPITGFSYFVNTNTATWTFANPAATGDKLMLDLNADAPTGATSDYGLRLDGEWANGGDAFPSGNGSQGGDFRFRVNVLAGDATRDTRVNSLDLSAVRQRLNTASTDIGRTLYTAFADITGDGRINSLDLSSVRQRLNRQLPAAEPTAATALLSPTMPAAVGALFSTKRLDDAGGPSELLG
jgi:hypothetical protein